MTTEPDIPTPYFIVDPENQKLVSGEVSFNERSRQKLWKAIILVVFAFMISATLGLVLSRSPQGLTYGTLFVIALPALVFLEGALHTLYAARLHRQLESGQFLDGQIISSQIGWIQQRRQRVFMLTATYRFQSPDGDLLKRTVESPRRDLLTQAKRCYPEMRQFYPDDRDKERLQEFAPPVNTPVKIRYVNDFLFRVM